MMEINFDDPIFTPEERAILLKRAAEKTARDSLVDKYEEAEKIGDSKAMWSLTKEIVSVGGDRCEHDRSLAGSCVGCYELDQKIAAHLGLPIDED